MGDDVLLFESDDESDSHQGSSTERGNDPEVSLVRAIEHVGSSTQRVDEAVEPEATFELDLGGEIEYMDVGRRARLVGASSRKT